MHLDNQSTNLEIETEYLLLGALHLEPLIHMRTPGVLHERSYAFTTFQVPEKAKFRQNCTRLPRPSRVVVQEERAVSKGRWTSKRKVDFWVFVVKKKATQPTLRSDMRTYRT
jgi:hypothetical protein